MNKQNFTKILHALIAVGITINLFISLFMAPGEMGVKGDGTYLIHQWTGLGLFLTLLTYWIWKFSKNLPQSWRYFFPWFEKTTYPKLRIELSTLLRFQFQKLPESGILSGAVHGLGLLTASVMAVTGAIQYLLLARYFTNSGLFELSKGTHELFATFMWIYLIGHVAMASLHQVLGHKSITRIFSSHN